MLDYGISFRCLLAWATGTAAVLLVAVAWLSHSDSLGRVGLVLMGLACTQWVLQDNARTRRCLRAEVRLRDEGLRISRVP